MSLEEKIKDHIRKNGFIAVDDFMNFCLFDKEFGYYIKKNPLGKDNDFITSPEISVLFGETLGLFLVTQIQEKLSHFEKICIVELGAGKATMMNDILNALAKFNDVYQKINVNILEISPTLVEIQKNTLNKHTDKLNWINSLEDLQNGVPTVFLANEFFDALTVKQFVKQCTEVKERVIKMDNNGNFIFDVEATNTPLIINEIAKDVDDNTIIEYSDESIGYMKKISKKILKDKGFALIIDYGYTDFVFGDTLQSIYKHKHNNIFDHIGEADLTTHVNFRILYATAASEGLSDLYLYDQGSFLTSLGILERTKIISEKLNEKEKKDLFVRVNRLTSLQEMGGLFKCMIAEKF